MTKNKKEHNHLYELIYLLLKIIICEIIVFFVLDIFQNREYLAITESDLVNSRFGEIMLVAGILFLLINFSALVWRAVLFLQYKSQSAVSDDQLPECTVVVPAFNEGRQVYSTLQSLVNSDYPKEKLNIIAVDDGSNDDTWRWIRKARNTISHQILTLRHPKNRGKRHALHTGFIRSSGRVVITVDSDSIVNSDTLRNMVSPFVKDPRIGAVAGNVRVLNMTEGIIPKMLDIIFVFSFDFIRASQSMVNSVLCTPGALSAYRRDIVMRVLPEWLNQKFFNRPANIGEDRAMTNLILREGYHTKFQQSALVYTNVPTGYQTLSKMFLRWARSNVRETIAMTRFAFRNFRSDSKLGARVNLLLGWYTLIKAPILLAAAACSLFIFPQDTTHRLLAGIILGTTFPALLYWSKTRNSNGLWAYMYGFFWFFALSWIIPYALFTAQKSGWLTRQVNEREGWWRTIVVPLKRLVRIRIR